MRVSQGALSGVRSLSIQAGGQLAANSGTLAWSGDWADAGQFDAGTSSASWVDRCGASVSTFSAAEAFHAFSLESAQGREIRFANGKTITVGQSFMATGVPARPLRIRSTVAGGAAFLAIAPTATQSVSAVDVADNHASPRLIAPGPAANYQSIKGTNSDGWFEVASAQIPALSGAVLALVAAALAFTALLRLSKGAS
jgi:hypothetical protein